MSDRPHRRFNPLSGEWVLVSPHRLERPWEGRREPEAAADPPTYDAGCYLCPGNARAGGRRNADYSSTFVFDNDFPALIDDVGAATGRDETLFRSRPVAGAARVICYSPRHDLTLARLAEGEIAAVVDCWAAEAAELGARYAWVQVFENRGELMGCSNPHPHGQVWAQSELPTTAVGEDRRLAEYRRAHGSHLLLDYAEAEMADGERLVELNDDWLAVVPYWATWPFETLVMPRAPVAHLNALDRRQRRSLAALLKRLLARYDNLFECSFPYSMGWHGAPFDGAAQEHWQLHAHFYPPLLRSAGVRKFMVGYEMLAEPQRDLTPEDAARQLKAHSSVHFRER